MPPLTILGTPRLTLDLVNDGTGSSANTVRITIVRFNLEVTVHVQTPQQTTLSDWDAGLVQMVTSGIRDLNCYGHSTNRSAPVIIDQLHLPPGTFFPDRNPASRLYVEATFPHCVDLAAYRPGQDISLRVSDNVGMSARVGATAVTHDASDNGHMLTGHVHYGYFYTYLVAREKSTGRMTPLYAVEWLFGARYRFINPGQGIPFTPVREEELHRIARHGPYDPRQYPFPVVAGDPIALVQRNRRQVVRQASCPTLSDVVRGMP